VRKLNAIVHPAVRERIRERIGIHRRRVTEGGAQDILVLDVPLLAESPLLEECDALVYVDAQPEVRRARTVDRGWPPGELERRESFQTPADRKRDMARWTVDNSGPPEAARRAIERVLREIEGSVRPENRNSCKHG
jgi:dephospho-CoA kinase